METCPKCNTGLYDAPGIGPYCPNPKCDVIDGILNWDQPKKPLFTQRTYTSLVQADADGELYITIPPELLDQLKWVVGDTVAWTTHFDNTCTITKTVT